MAEVLTPQQRGWPEGFTPADPNLTFEQAGLKEQDTEVPGRYWASPEGRLWIVEGHHSQFAKDYLGGTQAALDSGWVAVSQDEGVALKLEAKDTPALNNSAVELIVRAMNPSSLLTTVTGGREMQFLVGTFMKYDFKLGEWVEYLIDKQNNPKGSFRLFSGEDRTKVIEEPLTVDHLTITFHDKLFDYYLAAPNVGLDWYVTEIAGMKVGFGSKYQLKKFMLKLKTEFFTDGNIPGSNIRIAPIPEIEEPLVRRMGGYNHATDKWDSTDSLATITAETEAFREKWRAALEAAQSQDFQPGQTVQIVDPNWFIDWATPDKYKFIGTNIGTLAVKIVSVVSPGRYVVETNNHHESFEADKDRLAVYIAGDDYLWSRYMEWLDMGTPIRQAQAAAAPIGVTGGWHFSASVPIKENNLPIEVKRKEERGSVGPQQWEITDESPGQLKVSPQGPQF